MNSPNPDTQLEILAVKIKDVLIIGSSVFQLPLEVVELPGLEVIEI